ncbi:flagellin N-terminal helical domain-containing protein [Mycoplana ramosa]|uniref:Flagellin n=1 Tax=Mycoplana ramosa TaxID=40837 RepID=A0ABW3YWW3_MYCRA
MASILTNSSAMSALQTLRSINNSMETTQDRISTGMRVGAAKDNAAYWSIATTMRSDNQALAAASDALGLGAAKVDTAYAGMSAAIEVVKEIKAKLTTASEAGVDKVKVQEEITQLQEQLKSIGAGATFNGENWLAGGSATETVVTGFTRYDDSGTSKVKVTTANYDASTNSLFGAVDANGDVDDSTGILTDVMQISLTAADDVTSIATHLDNVETALTSMQTAGSQLGSMSKRISLQEDFAAKLSDALDKGIGRLVDADMNEESTRLKAMQTQQQLAIQSLSIANSNSQNILSLFR